MAKRKFYATTAVAKDTTFNLEVEFQNKQFSVINTSVKRDVGDEKLEKIKSPTSKDLEDPTVRVFAMLDIEDVEEMWVTDMAVLNKYGFQDVIDRKADGSFTLKDGAVISNIGDTVSFAII